MSLAHTPGPAFQFAADNLTGTPSATGLAGTAFAYGGSNADGSAVGVLGALDQDACYLVVGFAGGASTGEDGSSLVDILIDPAGGTSWASLVDDLAAGCSPTQSATVPAMCWYHLPLYIPAGATLGVQGRRNGATASSGRCIVQVFGAPSRPDQWWCGQGVEGIGINAASSKGTSHTPGSTGVYSAYATVGTSAKRHGAIQFTVNGADNNMLARGYYWQIGISGAQAPGTPTYYHTSSGAEVITRTGHAGPIFCDFPEGTTYQTRATCNGTSEAHDVAIYGVY